MNRASVSAIVVTYQTGPYLKECLTALDAETKIGEIIIVDNGNSRETRRDIDAFVLRQARFTLLSGRGNIGFGAGVNLGVTAAKGDHILVINPDAVLCRGSVARLQDTAQHLTEPWIVGGRIFKPDGREDRGGRCRKLTLARAVGTCLGFNTWSLEHTPPPDNPIPMDSVSGAFFLISRNSFDSLEGFDENYFLYVEDVDLCRRCHEAGGNIMYDPQAAALHYESTSNVSRMTIARHKASSLQYYFHKFARGPGERFAVGLLTPLIQIAARLRTLKR